MKTQILIWTFLFTLLSGTVMAQVPQKAEDISPLLYGEKIPDVPVVSTEGKSRHLTSIVRQKPTVLLIYRGGWCPYCNAHLAEIQEAEQEIIDLGYQLLAISPDSPENLKNSEQKHALKYALYSDADGALIKALGIAFQSREKYQDLLSKRSAGRNAGLLPVPSVFVVDKEGTILFEYINPDYKTRISAGLLLAVLKELKQITVKHRAVQ